MKTYQFRVMLTVLIAVLALSCEVMGQAGGPVPPSPFKRVSDYIVNRPIDSFAVIVTGGDTIWVKADTLFIKYLKADKQIFGVEKITTDTLNAISSGQLNIYTLDGSIEIKSDDGDIDIINNGFDGDVNIEGGGNDGSVDIEDFEFTPGLMTGSAGTEDITNIDSLDVARLTSPLVVGGTSTTSDLSLKTTAGVGASGADMHFLVGDDGDKEAMTILNNGRVGIGTNSPNGSLEIKGPNPGDVGGWPAGALQIRGTSAVQYTPVVITGHNSYNGNTQLWYLGSHSSANDDIGFINRQDAAIHFWTNNTARMCIDKTGYVGIGTTTPPERLSVVGSIATGDTIAGDLDVYHYFSTDGSWVTEYLKWDDGLLRFELSDDLDIGSNDLTGVDSLDAAVFTDKSVHPIDINQDGASTGQVLKWDGIDWSPGSDIGAGGGENNTLADTGASDEVTVFGLTEAKAGVQLRIRTLEEGSNITLTQGGDSSIIITSSGGGIDYFIVLNVGDSSILTPDGGIGNTHIGLNSDVTLRGNDMIAIGTIKVDSVDAAAFTDGSIDLVDIGTFSSAEFASQLTDGTGSGVVVFGSQPFISNSRFTLWNSDADSSFEGNPDAPEGMIQWRPTSNQIRVYRDGEGHSDFYEGPHLDSVDVMTIIADSSIDRSDLATDAVLLNDIGDPDGNSVISLGTYGITLNIANPSSNAFELNATGAFSGHLFHVHQVSGNPGATHLVHIEGTDPDVVPLCALSGQDTVMIFGGSGGPTFTSWIDSSGNFYIGNELHINKDSISGDAVIKFSDSNQDETIHWDQTEDRFEFSDDVFITGDILVGGIVDGVDIAARDVVLGQIIDDTASWNDHVNDTLYYIFTVPDPDAYFALDAEWIIDKFITDAITIVSIDVTLDADPTTEFEFSVKFADAFIGLANATVIDDTATVAGVTTVTGGFGDATVPADKVIYFVIDADPDDAITQAGFKIGFTVD